MALLRLSVFEGNPGQTEAQLQGERRRNFSIDYAGLPLGDVYPSADGSLDPATA